MSLSYVVGKKIKLFSEIKLEFLILMDLSKVIKEKTESDPTHQVGLVKVIRLLIL